MTYLRDMLLSICTNDSIVVALISTPPTTEVSPA